MRWYAVVNRETGEAVSFGTVLANPMPVHLEAVPIGDRRPDFTKQQWDPATRALVDLPPAPEG